MNPGDSQTSPPPMAGALSSFTVPARMAAMRPPESESVTASPVSQSLPTTFIGRAFYALLYGLSSPSRASFGLRRPLRPLFGRPLLRGDARRLGNAGAIFIADGLHGLVP